jgi:hypothetical protein
MKPKIDQSYRVKANMFINFPYIQSKDGDNFVSPKVLETMLFTLSFFVPIYPNYNNINDIIIYRLKQSPTHPKTKTVLGYADNLSTINLYYNEKSIHMVNPFLTDIAMFIGV